MTDAAIDPDLPWKAGDGTTWIYFPPTGEWTGWVEGEAGTWTYSTEEFRSIYPEAPEWEKL